MNTTGDAQLMQRFIEEITECLTSNDYDIFGEGVKWETGSSEGCAS